jgi:hypothetical protein
MDDHSLKTTTFERLKQLRIESELEKLNFSEKLLGAFLELN